MSESWVTVNFAFTRIVYTFAASLILIRYKMDITEHVKEFRTLQKKQKIRVADFCREHILDVYKIIELPTATPDGIQG